MSERQGVEIDYCPECRGIWLDRGELDKILERAQSESEAFARPAEPRGYDQDRRVGQDRRAADAGYDRANRDSRRDGYGDPRSADPRYAQKRKKSPFDFLGELFE